MNTLAANMAKVADQVWIALALLTRENPARAGFSGAEIRERVRQEFGSVPPGVVSHVSQHSVATKPVSPSRNRMITKRGSLNALYREGDPCHSDRAQGKTQPKQREIPERFHDLLAWYEESYAGEMREFGLDDAFLRYTPSASGLRDVAALHDEYLGRPPRPHPALYAAEAHAPYYAMSSLDENWGNDD